MNTRIAYLKNITKRITADIAAFGAISQNEYINCSKEEIFRKAHFLSCFAIEIPVIIDENEIICGSLRFWDNMGECRNKGHIIPDYRTVLKLGISGIKEKISSHKTEHSKAFLESVNAFSVFVERYAKKALEIYRETGNEDMKTVSDNCFCLLSNPPENFHQALQLIWFVHLFLHAEGCCAAVSFGRFDDYLYSYYKRDIENGVPEEKIKELLMCFWLKTCEGDESQNLTLGGDIENELTFLCIEVTRELKVQQPSVSVRVNEKTSEKLWQKIVELIKCKTGMPAVFNDSVIIKSLKNIGVADDDAENYAIVGCYEANPDGKALGTTANAGSFCLNEILLEFLSLEKVYSAYSEFYDDFKKFLREKYNNDILKSFKENWKVIERDCISPFQSACMGGCLESGIATEAGGAEYTMFGINILGIGTLIDSIYTIKKVVFEEKEYEYTEFINQVKNNFPDKELLKKCRSLPGKYGTDNAETNELANDLSVFIADLTDNGKICDGVIPYAGLFIFLGDVYSENYSATPDGRMTGERISYGIAASDLCEGKTLTSLLNSAAHIANDRFADGNPLMFGINEKLVSGKKGDEILKSLIKGYFEKGGFHVQINVTDSETLKKAKENPEMFSDLIVRISGYSEYFNKLDEDVQNSLIERS